MEKINPTLEKTLSYMTYGSLMILALGLVTSTTLLALSHILIIVPAIYFLTRADYKNYSKSAWALLAMTFIIIISVLVNQDIAINGYKPIFKAKYFLFGFLAIAPFSWYFKNNLNKRKISWLLYAFFIATTFATIVGIYSKYSLFNPVTLRNVSKDRNAGLFGMVMNYAHNMAYFQIIITSLVFYRKEIQKYINSYFLYIIFAINSMGLYLTYTRGAWLGFLVGIPFLFFKNNKKWFATIIVALAILGIVVYSVAGKNVIRPQSDQERLSQWQAAIMAFKERPVFGYGYLNFEQHSVEIKKRYNIGQIQFGGHAHSNVFEMLGSTGALGLIAFFFWITLWFLEMYKRTDVIAKTALPFIVVFFVSGLTQSTISLGINLFFIMAAYSITQINIRNIKN
ncbi:O-antigen ligase family protein [Bacteriovorax sp. PP10]|uniref:O-antigen ligase family protein n=1 Tax=Bacteriovorax antarcticus TaxID=3088717 RepID=A0ABU5VUG5_9BACT|nr:O-antigen ligase family protein [Bacteriovorax sp. PP10]MEA9356611.1 O-antigen ligase family protein [Bacteriovorax sp. PP10]